MKKETFILIMLVLVLPAVSAKELSVVKLADRSKLNAGESLTITLKVTNPFAQAVKLRIKDADIIGGSGVDIQCIERDALPNSETEFRIEGINVYSEGTFTIDPAQITYTDPEAQDERVVYSNNVSVTVEGMVIGQTMNQVKQIYQCDGMNMQSTQMSMSSGSQTQQQEQQEQAGQQSQQQSSQTQQKTNSMQQQTSQDMNSLKQQMDRQMQEAAAAQQALAQKIEQDERFKEAHEDLMHKGYKPSGTRISPESNSSGNFTYDYQRADGENASISGRMEDDEVKSLQTNDSEQQKAAKHALESDPRYQQMSQELKGKGFEQQGMHFSHDGNRTDITVQFNQTNSTSNQTRTMNITARVENWTVTRITLEGEDWFPWFRLIIGILALLPVAVLVVRRRLKTRRLVPLLADGPVASMDYHAEARKMLKEAEALFGKGEEKEAYALVSLAVRFYYSNRLGMRTELTRDQLVSVLRQDKRMKGSVCLVGDCLDLCSLVEFAKYIPNAEDFGRIIGLANDLVK